MAAVMANNINKRKRDTSDLPIIRSAPGLGSDNDFTEQYLNEDVTEATDNGIDFSVLQHTDSDSSHRAQALTRPGQSASDTATAALAQYHTMTVPTSTEQTFLNQSNENGDRSADSSDNAHRPSTFVGDVDFNASPGPGDQSADPSAQNIQPPTKPAVGTEEWHKVRKDNHKEVERRRRETINEGINELAKIVPGCEKNKGSILARAVQFITQLKLNETQNIEKWTLEKMLSEQAISELSSTVDKLKSEVQRAWAEVEQWKQTAQKAGVQVDVDDKSGVNEV